MDSLSDRTLGERPDLSTRPTSDRVSAPLDLVLQALRAPVMSYDHVRARVERYGALAREQALQLEEMLANLTRAVREVLESLPSLPSPLRDEVLAFVQWWALHGYHRAD